MPNQRFSRRDVLRAAGAASVGTGGVAFVGSLVPPDTERQLSSVRPPAVKDGGCPRPNPSKLHTRTTEEGTHFVDEHGRVVVLRGVNMVDKGTRSSSYPPSELDDRDFRRLAAWGFNFVRLGIQWAKITPKPPQAVDDVDSWVDDSYLDRVRRVVRKLAAHDIYVLLDFHQDIYSRVFAGNGAPEWAVYNEGLSFANTNPWWTGYLQPAVLSAFDHFWRNEAAIQEAAARAWRAVAARLGDEPNVVGYDLFNEPVPGPTTFADFERRQLPEFLNRTIDRIRDVDTETAIWVEPPIYFGGGVPSRLDGVTDPADNLGFSFHSYPELILDKSPADDWMPGLGAGNIPESWLIRAVLAEIVDGTRADGEIGQDFDMSDLGHRLILDNALEASQRLGAAPVMTEFGAHQDADDVADAVDATTDGLVSWAYWQYKPWQETPGGWLVDRDRVSANLAPLIRPYPHAVAGTPLDCTYDRPTRKFRLVYRPDPEATAMTVLHVPDRVYDGAYAASVAGGDIACRSPEYLRVRERSPERVSVTVEPA